MNILDKNTPLKVLEKAFEAIMKVVHPNPSNPELLKTPNRAAKALLHLTEGYSLDPFTIVKGALFELTSDSQMVIVKQITLNSMCEHHLLPFIGKCDIGYIPNGKILGLSKFSRVVDVFARRLQVQERLTYEIATFLNDCLKPKGVVVRISAQHMCTCIRGIEDPESYMATMECLGAFKDNNDLTAQFLSIVP